METGPARSKRRKKGLRDIAEAVSVSVATVSRVMNSSARVDPEIQKKVREAAAQLGIDFESKNRTLAFVLGNREMRHPFHSHILLGAEDYCRERGWDLLFLTFQYTQNAPWKDLHLPQVMRRRDMARAIILAGTHSENLLEALTHRGAAFAVLGNNVVGPYRPDAYDMVFSDDTQGAYEMTRYLISLRHQDICFVGNLRLPWYARCHLGYERAMNEAGLAPRVCSVESSDEQETGYLATKSILSGERKISAIFAGTDPTARGVYKAAGDLRLRIPQDVSVVSCNNTYGAWLNPPLTSIREYPEQLGKRLVELALSRIAQPDRPSQQVTVPTELVKRESCVPFGAAYGAESDAGVEVNIPPEALVKN